MNVRRVVSLTALAGFVLLVVTSIVLYVVPAGRVAYWADWRLWGMTKEQWGSVHINLGVLLLAAIGVHLFYNWRAVTTYLKNRARRFTCTPECGAALVLCVVVVAGTLAMVPPFSWVIELGDHFKDQAALEYGEPPYGHAELSSLTTFAARQGVDVDAAVARMRDAGLRVEDASQTVQDVARANAMSPKQVYDAMRPEEEAGPKPFPTQPPAGFGNRTLADVCAAYGLHPPDVVRALAGQGMAAEAGQTIKQIAAANGVGPMDVFEALSRVAAP